MREPYARSVGQRIIQHCTLCEKRSAQGSICEPTEGGGRNFVACGSLCKIVLAFLRVPLPPLQCKSAIQPPGAIALLIVLPNKKDNSRKPRAGRRNCCYCQSSSACRKKCSYRSILDAKYFFARSRLPKPRGASPSPKLFIGVFSLSGSCIIKMGL